MDVNANQSRERLKKRSLSVEASDESNDISDTSALKRLKTPFFCVKEVELETFFNLMGMYR